MGEYQREIRKFISRGLNLVKPPDLLPPEFYPYIKNIRQYSQGVLSQRPGMTALNASAVGAVNVHSVSRINSALATSLQPFARVIGAGTQLYTDNGTHTAFTSRATGFTGDPMSMVIMRPAESPEPWLYVSDRGKSGKVNVNGTFYNHGIAPPVVAPYAQQAKTSIQIIDDFEAVGAWTNGGTAGAITLQTRISTTITKIVYDSGATGWATVQPALQDETLQPGMLLIVNAGETVLVEFVSEAVTSTTISSIQYDAGVTGLCTIQLVTPTDGLARDSMLRIDSGGGGDEVVRVLSVTFGPDGIPSLRCATVNTQSAGKTITGLRSFRANFVNNHVAGETLTSGNLRSTITAGTGYMTKTISLDLSTVNGRPITPDDEMHVSILLDIQDNLTEGRVELDVDRNTNDFTQNYYYKVFRANDLSPASTGAVPTLTAQQRVLQRSTIDIQSQLFSHIDRNQGNQGPDVVMSPTDVTPIDIQSQIQADAQLVPDVVTQTVLGASQWTELRFKVSDLLANRVGSDTSRSLHDVAAIRIQLITTGPIQMDVDAWWIGGTYGPDISGSVGAPYNYRYVYRSSVTGAKSNPSPPMRMGISPLRQSVVGTVTASTDPQVDWIDIYRTGGVLIANGSPAWFYVMSVPNSSPAFTDNYGDDVVIRNPQLDFDNFQPFLDLDVPRSGTCNVIGTEVTRTGGNDFFNTQWPAGTIIVINNVPYTLYAQPSSITKLSLSENAGTQNAVTWYVTTPRLQARPLPCMWGPFGTGMFAPVLFACGSGNQPHKLFYTRAGNADSNGQYGNLDLTSPSEPLMNGCIFNSLAYVFSSEALYILQPTVVDNDLTFSGTKVEGNKGLFSRYAMCTGDEGIFYLSRDGIYLTNGAQSISLTDEALYPLFPHEGAPAQTTNGIVPPNFDFPESLRLSYGESMLYFDFSDTNFNRATLIYDIKYKGWFYYVYTPGVLCHYTEEGSGLSTMVMGGTDGRLYLSGGVDDNSVGIACGLNTSWFDAGDPRAPKQWGDGLIDMSSQGSSVQIMADNDLVTLGSYTIIGGTRFQTILDFTQSLHKNVSLHLSNIQGAAFQLYGYEFSYIPKPETSIFRDTDWNNLGTLQAKFIQGCRIHTNTLGVTRTLQVWCDEANTGVVLTVNANGEQVLPFSWEPFIGHLVRLVPQDGDPWALFEYEFVYDLYPELTTTWKADNTSFEFPEYGHVYYAYIKHISTTDITLSVIIDNTTYTYTIPNSGGVPVKTQIMLQAIKGKLFQFGLTSAAGFRLFRNQSIVYGKPERGANYQPLMPFGAESALEGAKI